MGRNVFAVLLVVALLLGLAARLAPISERRLDAGANELGDSRWIVDDASTALHLRRIELALAEGRVPQHDPLQAHGAGPEIPSLPVFDALLAGFAQRWLADADGDPALGGVDEADLEAFAAWFGPVAYVLAFATLAWSAWIATRGAQYAVLLAAVTFATAPAAIAAGEVGRLDAAALALVLLGLLVRSTQVAVHAEDALTTILEALLGGVVAGLLASMSAAGPFLALPTAAAFLVRALRGPIAVRPIAVRAGLLFTLIAAFTSRLPLAEGPWESLPGGLVERWTLAASDLLLVSAAPFALLLLTAPRDEARKGRTFARIAMLAAMLALLVFELPRAWAAASAPIAAWWKSRALLGVDPASDTAFYLLVSLVIPCAAVVSLLRFAVKRDAPSLHLASLVLVTTALACFERATTSLCVLACAVAVAGGITSLWSERAQRWWLVGLGLPLVLVALIDARFRAEFGSGFPTEKVERFAALRWIRDNVPAGGPFNSSSAQSTWGILANPYEGELVAYHARRPVLASSAAAFSHPELFEEAARLVSDAKGPEIVERMRVRRLRLAIASHTNGGLLGWAGREAIVAGETVLPGAELLVPRELPQSWGSVRTAFPIVWSIGEGTAPRVPSMIAPR